MSVEDLRDVLRERAEGPAPANPYRSEQVRERVRRVRRRRTVATVTLAGAATAVTVLASVAVTGALQPGGRDAASVPRVDDGGAELPAYYVSPDGTAYRRLEEATVDARGEKTTITVTSTGRPLEAAVMCGRDPFAIAPEVLVNGRPVESPGIACAGPGMQLRPLEVPAGAGEVTVTFDTTGPACVRRTEHGPCTPERPRGGRWKVAVYDWTPPERPVKPRPVTLPDRLDGAKRIKGFTGTWPGDGSYETTVTAPGRYTIERDCSGDLGDRLWFKYWIDGVESRSLTGCGARSLGADAFTVRKGQKVKVRVRVGLWGAATNRPVAWAVALYRK
ncbi:hypothetical protein ACFMQL_30205 [Nonomuraea fastidiosa]|uniref:hypothetical protein n=1 Tax=Nonomuraea fastidiosa TaxID=46173 RepID=UPI00366D7F6E